MLGSKEKEKVFGGICGGDTPGSMPNPVVKSSSADGTAGGTRGRVGHCQKPFFCISFPEERSLPKECADRKARSSGTLFKRRVPELLAFALCSARFLLPHIFSRHISFGFGCFLNKTFAVCRLSEKGASSYFPTQNLPKISSRRRSSHSFPRIF